MNALSKSGCSLWGRKGFTTTKFPWRNEEMHNIRPHRYQSTHGSKNACWAQWNHKNLLTKCSDRKEHWFHIGWWFPPWWFLCSNVFPKYILRREQESLDFMILLALARNLQQKSWSWESAKAFVAGSKGSSSALANSGSNHSIFQYSSDSSKHLFTIQFRSIIRHRSLLGSLVSF